MISIGGKADSKPRTQNICCTSTLSRKYPALLYRGDAESASPRDAGPARSNMPIGEVVPGSRFPYMALADLSRSDGDFVSRFPLVCYIQFRMPSSDRRCRQSNPSSSPSRCIRQPPYGEQCYIGDALYLLLVRPFYLVDEGEGVGNREDHHRKF